MSEPSYSEFGNSIRTIEGDQPHPAAHWNTNSLIVAVNLTPGSNHSQL